jgi:hypothetical protein
MLNVFFNPSSKESTTAKTAVIMKIPTMTPSNDKNVRKRLVTMADQANAKLSPRRRNHNMSTKLIRGA